MARDINFTTITSDEYKQLDKFEIGYGFYETKFGQCLIGVHDRQICSLAFCDDGKENSALDLMKQDWPNATLVDQSAKLKPLSKDVFEEGGKNKQVQVLLRGTELQCNVWRELAKLKVGSTASYEQVAKAVGNPRAIRAVASSIAKNRVAYLVPCHRVIRKTGAPNKYRWGPERKIKMLDIESKM